MAENWPGLLSDDEQTENTVKRILSDVKSNGDEALPKYTQKFDGIPAGRS